MHLSLLKPIEKKSANKSLIATYEKLQKLIIALNQRELDEEFVHEVNSYIDSINALPENDRKLKYKLGNTYNKTARLAEKKLKLVTKGYYRNLWLVLGMSIFGVPMGLAISLALDSFAFLGVGFALGMPIGIALGTTMDQKAEKEGRQLDA